MAQTGYTPILIYSSSTVSQAPAAGNLTNSTLGSELAINITDGKLFYKDNANAVQVIAWKVTPTTAGGTGLTSYTAGDLLYYASGTTLTKLAIGASGRWLGSSGTAPQWNAPAALTKTDDTNVTLTLGGNASTALLNAASLTLGWTGQLATTRGGTGLSSFTSGGVLYASSTSALATGSVLTFNGTNFAVGAAPGSAKGLIVGLDQTTGNVDTAGNIDFEISSTGSSVASGGSLIFSASSGAWKFAAIKGLATNGANNTQGSVSISTRRAATDAALTEAIRFHASGGISINAGTDPTVGNLLLGTGNVVQGTAAKGFNFTANTPAAGMTSQLLNWYEEGTWTPSITNWTVSGTPTITGRFTRVGRLVTFHAFISHTTSTQSVAGTSYINGLPYTPGADSSCLASSNATDVGYGTGSVSGSNTTDQIYPPSATLGANQVLVVTGTYYV